MKIAFVCHGNVNRSRAGEEIMKSLGFSSVESFAIGLKSKDGRPITKKMRTILQERSIPFDFEVRSRVMKLEDVENNDIIFIMDDSNLKYFQERFGELGKEKIRFLGEQINVKKIADPGFSAGTEKFYKAFEQILEACKIVKLKIDKNEKL